MNKIKSALKCSIFVFVLWVGFDISMGGSSLESALGAFYNSIICGFAWYACSGACEVSK